MFAILALGFAMGLQHAMEADHLAAVATLASRNGRASDIVKHGLTWGLGHTLTLLALAGVAMILGRAIPDSLANGLEFAVGIMLCALGAHLWSTSMSTTTRANRSTSTCTATPASRSRTSARPTRTATASAGARSLSA